MARARKTPIADSSRDARQDSRAAAGKERLDVLLVERGFAPTRQQAQALIMEGKVRVASQRADKGGSRFPRGAPIEVENSADTFASRGGRKLEGALRDFSVEVTGKICVDIGSSNGGFTDCLLHHGAARVHAIDVNTEQLDWKLRTDPRVFPLKCNARYLRPDDIGENAELVTMDVSFISAGKILPAAAAIARPGAIFLILVKPQFELERKLVGKGGIVRDSSLHERAIKKVTEAARKAGLCPGRCLPSRLPGAGGNQEFFLLAWRAGQSTIAPDSP